MSQFLLTPTMWLLLVLVLLVLGGLIGYAIAHAFDHIDNAEAPPKYLAADAGAVLIDVRKARAKVPDPRPALKPSYTPPEQKKPAPAHWNELAELRELANEEERMLGRAAALNDIRNGKDTGNPRNPHHNGTQKHLMWDVGYQQMLAENGRKPTTRA